jgi:hypothetical protein
MRRALSNIDVYSSKAVFSRGVESNRGDGFGAAVAMSDDCVAVGAPQSDGIEGSVYMYSRNALTQEWEMRAQVHPPLGNHSTSAYFGFAVSMSPRTLFVGAPGYNGNVGAVLVYDLGDLALLAVLSASDGHTNDYFGEL